MHICSLFQKTNFFQNEEIEAMAAIYGEEWCVIDDCAKIFCIRISDDIDDPKWTLCLQVDIFFFPFSTGIFQLPYMIDNDYIQMIIFVCYVPNCLLSKLIIN